MSNSFSSGFQFITLWIQGIPHGFEVYYRETNNLVSIHQREHHVYFLQAFVTSVGIKALTYLGLMANRQDSDHHNNDDGNDVDNIVLTRAEFLEFLKRLVMRINNFLKRVGKL